MHFFQTFQLLLFFFQHFILRSPCYMLHVLTVMTGQRHVDPSAVRYLIGRIKQAKVSGQKQEYQRQGRDVNNTRQKSGSQA